MPAELDDETVGKIVLLRAMDFTKEEIAERLDVSRNTVRHHLEQVQEEALAETKIPAMVVVNRILGNSVFEWSYETLREEGDT